LNITDSFQQLQPVGFFLFIPKNFQHALG
jgi:hypothetical protein